MAILSAPRSWQRVLTLGIVSAAAATSLFFGVRSFFAHFIEERETCAKVGDGIQQIILIANSGSGRPLLDPGIYHLDLTGYCYRAECNIDLRESFADHEVWPDSKVSCRGSVDLINTNESVTGLLVPHALKTLNLRVMRNGAKSYDGDILTDEPCTSSFCFVNASK